MKLGRRFLLGGSVLSAATGGAMAADPPPRQLPARSLPVPGTVSPELRAVIAAPYPPGWDAVPQTAEAWRALAQRSSAAIAPLMPAFRASLGVTVQAARIAGVPVFRITPRAIPERNRRRLLMHLHGGGYVLYPGEVGAGEGMLMAGLGGFEVVSVDYRMPPDHPFPAALDDATAVWRALLAENDASRMAIFGISAGGGLTLATVLHARDQGIALPAAIAPGTPWVDLAGDGDSRNANAFVDNILVADAGWLGGAARLYAGGHDLRDPLISPIHGDFHGLPPAIITTGTRDLFLSDSVRTHRKLRQAGIDAALQVFEGMSHGQFVVPGVPETTEAFREIAAFFDRHLAV